MEMLAVVRVEDLAGRELRRERIKLSRGVTVQDLLLRLGVAPGSIVWVDGRRLEPSDPVVPALEKSGQQELRVRDP